LKKDRKEPRIVRYTKNLLETENITFSKNKDDLLFFVILSKYSTKILVGRVE